MTLADFVVQRVKEYTARPLPYDAFCDIVTFAAPQFKFTSSEETSKAVIEELKKLDIEVGTQEVTLQHKWPGQLHVVPFSKGNPGSLAEPMNSHHATLEYKDGDYVAVAADTWRDKFDGVVNKIKGEMADIVDYATGMLYENIPLALLSKPLAKGRPIAPPQYRRIGDPLGLMDSPRDSGDPNMTRVYPGVFMLPKGTEGDSVVNPPSMFYASLAEDVKKYIAGQAVDLTSELVSVLNKQGLLRLP